MSFADLPNLQASQSPLVTIPPAVMVARYRLEHAIHNTVTNSITLLELTCPLYSEHHLQSARSHKQKKVEYQPLLAELDLLNICNYYETLKVSVLDHYYHFCVNNLRNLLYFIHQNPLVSKTALWKVLDDASQHCITASQRMLMAWNRCKWFPFPD